VMIDPTKASVRVLCDFNGHGDLIGLAYELWLDGKPTKGGWRPVGPFDRPQELYDWVEAHVGYQLALDLT
jgi:hypothetical protein